METPVVIAILSFLYISVNAASARESFRTASYKRQYSSERLPAVSLIREAITSSRLICGVACSGNMECQAYSFKGNTGSCQLYKVRPPLDSGSPAGNRNLFFVRNTENDMTSNDLPSFKPKGRAGIMVKRILFARVTKTIIFQLYVQGDASAIRPYVHIKPCFLLAVHYSPKLKLVFLAQTFPNKLMSSSLDSARMFVVICQRYTSLSVDGENELIFAINSREIHSMTTKGSSFKIILSFDNFYTIKAVAVDGRKRSLFVAYRFIGGGTHLYSVVAVSYLGSILNTVVSNSPNWIVSLDYEPAMGTLVYKSKDRIMLYNVLSKNHSFLLSADLEGDIRVVQQTVFVVDRNVLIIYDHKLHHKKFIELPKTEYTYKFCPIY